MIAEWIFLNSHSHYKGQLFFPTTQDDLAKVIILHPLPDDGDDKVTRMLTMQVAPLLVL